MSGLFEENHPIKRLQRAETLFMSGRLCDAARHFRPLRGDPVVGDTACRRLAYITLLSGNAARAQGWLQALPRDDESLRMLAAFYRRTGELGAAAACVRSLGSDLMAQALRRLAESPLEIDAPGPIACPLVSLDPLPLVAATVDGHRTRFLLDTGSQEVVLDEALVERLGLWRSAPQDALHAGGRHSGLRYGRVNTLELGSARFRNLPIQVQPLRPTFERMFDDGRVEGILGMSLLSHFFMEADFAAGELRLHPPQAAPRHGHRFWMADAFLPLLQTTVNDRLALPMLLDTGQQGFALAVSAEAARSIQLPIADLPFAGEGGGGSVTVLPTRVDSVAFAGTQLDTPPALCMPRFGLEYRFGFRVGGLLGYEAVRGRRLTLDFRRMRLSVSEH